MKSLNQLFVDFPFSHPPGLPDTPVTGIAIDSRLVEPGNLFVAMQGGSVDGHTYIPKAVENGAAAVVGDKEIGDLAVPYVRLADSRRALTWLAAAFYDWPGRQLTVLGITGTDGKTTTANLLYQILLAAGLKAG